MTGLYVGACLVAGLFTMLPGCFLGSLLWGHTDDQHRVVKRHAVEPRRNSR